MVGNQQTSIKIRLFTVPGIYLYIYISLSLSLSLSIYIYIWHEMSGSRNLNFNQPNLFTALVSWKKNGGSFQEGVIQTSRDRTWSPIPLGVFVTFTTTSEWVRVTWVNSHHPQKGHVLTQNCQVGQALVIQKNPCTFATSAWNWCPCWDGEVKTHVKTPLKLRLLVTSTDRGKNHLASSCHRRLAAFKSRCR